MLPSFTFNDHLLGEEEPWQKQPTVQAYRPNFYVHGSVHRESVSIIVQQDATT